MWPALDDREAPMNLAPDFVCVHRCHTGVIGAGIPLLFLCSADYGRRQRVTIDLGRSHESRAQAERWS
jgi:hypothetical protein